MSSSVCSRPSRPAVGTTTRPEQRNSRTNNRTVRISIVGEHFTPLAIVRQSRSVRLRLSLNAFGGRGVYLLVHAYRPPDTRLQFSKTSGRYHRTSLPARRACLWKRSCNCTTVSISSASLLPLSAASHASLRSTSCRLRRPKVNGGRSIVWSTRLLGRHRIEPRPSPPTSAIGLVLADGS
jgi:hypothetical protein